MAILTKREEYARAWPVLIASALGAGTGVFPLVFYSLGALVGPLTEHFGWSRTEVTAAPMFFTVASMVSGVFVGGLADRIGARRVVIASQVLLVIGLAGMALIGPAIWTLYAGYFLLAILGAGTFTMTWARAITGWFVAGRGLALGLSLVGTGLIGAALPPYVNALVLRDGWQAGYLGLAALPLILGLPITILLFREPEEVAANAEITTPMAVEGADFADAIRTGTFWQMTLAFFVAAMAIAAVMVHAIPMMTDRGIDKSTAAAITSLIGIAVTIGRLFSGYLLDTISPRIVGFLAFVAPAAACALLLLPGNSLILCGLAVALIGLAGGAEHDIAGYITASVFGRRNYGAIYGLLYTIYCFGSGIGPLLMGAAVDHFHNYRLGLIVALCGFLVAALLIAMLRTTRPDEAHETPVSLRKGYAR
ncbi:MFS transporter [Sphingomonas sp. CGMCC 1.13654]|uniref:MFS transporter n=1 Tax=Sphingomonas chungangi TaxID=2683589 RepID=A0A838L6X8_9SPHN|nr:MFS transporter [Sphingomonas chungangi]